MSAFLYTLGLHTRYTTDEVQEKLCRLLGITRIDEVTNYWPALEIRADGVIDSLSREFWKDYLGTAATMEVHYFVDVKTDWEEARRAYIAMAVSVAKLTHETDALAMMTSEPGSLTMRRTNGVLYLYEQFGRWRDPEVVAQLPEPWILTDDIDAGIPEGAIPFR